MSQHGMGHNSSAFRNEQWVRDLIAEADREKTRDTATNREKFVRDLRRAKVLFEINERVDDPSEKGVKGVDFRWFAKRAYDMGRNKALELLKLNYDPEKYLRWMDEQAEGFAARYQEFDYNWRRVFRHFYPKDPDADDAETTTEDEQDDEPTDDDPGLAGDVPDLTLANAQAAIDAIADELTRVRAQRDAAWETITQLEEELSKRPPRDPKPKEQWQQDTDDLLDRVLNPALGVDPELDLEPVIPPDPEPDPPKPEPDPPADPEPDPEPDPDTDPPAPPTPDPEPESAARMSLDEARSWFLTQAGARASDLVSQPAMERMDDRMEKQRPPDSDSDFDANYAHAWEVLWGAIPAREPEAKAPTDGPAPDPKPDPAATVPAEVVHCPPEPDPLPPAPKPEPTPPVDDDWPYDGQPIDPPVAGEPDDLSKDLDATSLERLRARTGPTGSPVHETPVVKPLGDSPTARDFKRLLNMGWQIAEIAERYGRSPAEIERSLIDDAPRIDTPPIGPAPTETPSSETSILEKLRARIAAREAGETLAVGPYDLRSTKPNPKPEPYEYVANEPEDKLRKGKQTKQQIKRDRNRAEALRIAGGDPRRHDEWGNVATRVKGDCVKYGWIRIVNYQGAGNLPSLTDEGRERLERYEEDDPPE